MRSRFRATGADEGVRPYESCLGQIEQEHFCIFRCFDG